MKKTDLVFQVRKLTGLSLADSRNAVTAVVATIVEEMREGREVQIHGFMTFGHRVVKGRNTRNPSTGATRWRPGYMKPHTKMSPLLKAMLRAEEYLE